MRRLEYLEKRQRGTADFPIELYRLSPESERYIMQCHWHLEYELIAVHQGALSLILDEQRILAQAGDTVLLPGGTLHTGYPDECVYDCIVFSQDLLSGRNGSGTVKELLRRRPEKSIISSKEQEIILLKNELERIKNNELEYDRISKEIFRIKSSVHDVSITKGHLFNRDSTSGNAVISVVVSSVDSIAINELDELKEWLKVRLDTESVEVIQR
jgi:hypothetical protein